ncbi:MAG: hypothetical protein AAF639_24755 [Chloroflexota bacterium]
MKTFIRGMPKAELHLHIEGTLNPQMLLRLAKRNNIDFPYPSIDAIESALANRPAGLDDFLEHDYTAAKTMMTQVDFREVTHDLLRTLCTNNVVYVELVGASPKGRLH